MKQKVIVLDMEDVTGEKEKMTTSWDCDLVFLSIKLEYLGSFVSSRDIGFSTRKPNSTTWRMVWLWESLSRRS